ncbi:MAG: hypothetical protein R3240_05690, partial [Gammaproteobacteria bacterium]|nr:hypothetical protein [Gammaproteobacteria bacterium]
MNKKDISQQVAKVSSRKDTERQQAIVRLIIGIVINLYVYFLDNFSEQYNIVEKYQWVTWEHVLQNKKLADVLIITTPDRL